MLELAGAVVLAGGLASGLLFKMNERQKIELCFKNLKFGIKQGNDMKYPQFKRKTHHEDYTEYEYKIPLGLTVPDNLGVVLRKTLGKHVVAEGEGFLKLKVYKNLLPNKIEYDEMEKGESWEVPIGHSWDGTVKHDFDKIPHMTVAGTTRYGKTVLLKNLITRLIEDHRDDVEFYLVDLKGGLEFGRFEGLNQVKGLATDSSTTLDVVEGILWELQQDLMTFRQQHLSNIVGSPFKKRKFIIVDEAAQLTPDKFHSPEEKKRLAKCQAGFSEIARIGGGIGYRLIYCTQRSSTQLLILYPVK